MTDQDGCWKTPQWPQPEAAFPSYGLI